MTLNRRLGSLMAVMWLGLVLIGALGAWQNRESMMQDRRGQLVAIVQQALDVTQHYYQLAHQGRLSDADARQQALATLETMRYAKDGYIAVNDSHYLVLMNPVIPKMNGKDGSAMRDSVGQPIFPKLVEAGNQPDGGFAEYVGLLPGARTPASKTNFVMHFEPWDWYIATGLYTDDVDHAFHRQLLKWFVMTISLGGLLSLIMWFVLRSVRRMLGGDMEVAVEVAGQMSSGNLAAEVPVFSHDRASLLHALHRMREGLVDTVRRVSDGAESIDTGADEIAAGNSDLSQRTEEQAAALVQTASSMSEITGNVKRNAESAAQASQLASDAANVAHSGREVVDEAVRTMSEISRSSEQIGSIIEVIEGIAFQTNILALNAAVEAARAGEQGRGFAVVASEVRSLAQRSGGAAKEIKALIESSTQVVQTGASQITQAGKRMGEIVASISHVNEILEVISRASNEQSTGIEEVNRAIGEMDHVTQQNAALVEQAAAAAHSLRDQVKSLRGAIASFTLPT
ncbi:methyl-accepting chemotaxis protein [Paraburkholderia heleia]|uniref:methyl-accepting chemotaxis protein n=1 Tax=Paraburkholderia heleia TaxID=634127 RepID=UPI0031D29C7A